MKNEKITISIDENIVKKVRHICIEKKMSISTLFEIAIKNHMEIYKLDVNLEEVKNENVLNFEGNKNCEISIKNVEMED